MQIVPLRGFAGARAGRCGSSPRTPGLSVSRVSAGHQSIMNTRESLGTCEPWSCTETAEGGEVRLLGCVHLWAAGVRPRAPMFLQVIS